MLALQASDHYYIARCFLFKYPYSTFGCFIRLSYLEWTEEKVKKSWYIHMAKSKCTWSLDSLLWHKFLYGINWRSCLGFCVITIWLIVRFQVVYDCTLESLIYFSFLFTWFTSAVWWILTKWCSNHHRSVKASCSCCLSYFRAENKKAFIGGKNLLDKAIVLFRAITLIHFSRS